MIRLPRNDLAQYGIPMNWAFRYMNYLSSLHYISCLSLPLPQGFSSIRISNQVIFGRRHVGIMSAEPVGNYGVRIVFDDLHKTGIYTWDYIYHLGSNKFSLMRNYVKTLKKHGLSRHPPLKK